MWTGERSKGNKPGINTVGHPPTFQMDSEDLINALHKVFVVDYMI